MNYYLTLFQIVFSIIAVVVTIRNFIKDEAAFRKQKKEDATKSAHTPTSTNSGIHP